VDDCDRSFKNGFAGFSGVDSEAGLKIGEGIRFHDAMGRG
jgi:hypothetical protein